MRRDMIQYDVIFKQIVAGWSILFLPNLESEFAGRVVVEVVRSAARDWGRFSVHFL